MRDTLAPWPSFPLLALFSSFVTKEAWYSLQRGMHKPTIWEYRVLQIDKMQNGNGFGHDCAVERRMIEFSVEVKFLGALLVGWQTSRLSELSGSLAYFGIHGSGVH